MVASVSWSAIKIIGDYDTIIAWYALAIQFINESFWAPVGLFFIGVVVFMWGARQSGGGISLPDAPQTIFPAPKRLRHQKKERAVELVKEPIVSELETEESERMFVTKPLTEILSVFHNRTELAGEQLFSKYKGQWISVEGEVDDVSRMAGNFRVSLKLVEPYEKISASASFNTDQENFRYFGKGDIIKLIGRIRSGYETILFLDECELD